MNWQKLFISSAETGIVDTKVTSLMTLLGKAAGLAAEAGKSDGFEIHHLPMGHMHTYYLSPIAAEFAAPLINKTAFKLEESPQKPNLDGFKKVVL